MNCQCQHSPVCQHESEIRAAISQILKQSFGGINPAWAEMEKFIRDHCQWFLHEFRKNKPLPF